MNEDIYNKERIRNRMLKFAGAFWGVKKPENLDPVVKLLIESLANEINKLYEEFSGIETRLLEKTARMLSPGTLVSPNPAHAVMHATPVETSYLLGKDKGVYFENHSADKRDRVSNLSFYPSCHTLVRQGDIKCLYCNDALYAVDTDLNKDLMAKAIEKSLEPYTVWIGLDLHESITDLHHLSFYLDFPEIANSYEYLYLLSCTEWFFGETPVHMERGIYEIPEEPANHEQRFFADYNLAQIKDRTTTGLYRNNYLTVATSVPVKADDKTFLPEAISRYFSESATQNIQSPLLWLRVKFPSNFTARILQNIQAGINIVPVENKKLCESTTEINDTFALAPLVTEENECLLSVHSVTDAKGISYHELSYRDDPETAYGTYSLRRGGCERFDSRNAKDLLTYLIDLLTDETSAFGSLPSTKLRVLTGQMDLLIEQMKQVASNIQEHRELPYYVLIDQVKSNEQVTVKYWVTNCDAANGLNAGSELTPHVNTLLSPKDLRLVSSTYGGKKEPRFDERVDLYKYELTTRDRILTNDDIANFCRKELGELLTHIELRNGVAISGIPGIGLIRTKDLYLTCNEHLKNRIQEEQIKKDLDVKLKDRSPDTFNYRVFIQK